MTLHYSLQQYNSNLLNCIMNTLHCPRKGSPATVVIIIKTAAVHIMSTGWFRLSWVLGKHYHNFETFVIFDFLNKAIASERLTSKCNHDDKNCIPSPSHLYWEIMRTPHHVPDIPMQFHQTMKCRISLSCSYHLTNCSNFMTAMPCWVGEYIRSQGRSNSIERHMNGFAMKNVCGVYFSFLW